MDYWASYLWISLLHFRALQTIWTTTPISPTPRLRVMGIVVQNAWRASGYGVSKHNNGRIQRNSSSSGNWACEIAASAGFEFFQLLRRWTVERKGGLLPSCSACDLLRRTWLTTAGSRTFDLIQETFCVLISPFPGQWIVSSGCNILQQGEQPWNDVTQYLDEICSPTEWIDHIPTTHSVPVPEYWCISMNIRDGGNCTYRHD